MTDAFALRPRSTTEIIDAAFRLLRAEFANFLALSAAVFIPVIALQLLLPRSLAAFPQFLQSLLSWIAQGAMMVATSERILGRPILLGSCLSRSFWRSGWLFLAAIIQGIVLVIGLALLIVPGVWVFGATFAMPMIVLLEGAGPTAAFNRSIELTKGSVVRILATLAITGLVFLIIVILAGLAAALLNLQPGSTSSDLVAEIGIIVAYPLYAIVTTLLYYDLRIRREGFDLQLMAEQLDSGTLAMPATAPSAAG